LPFEKYESEGPQQFLNNYQISAVGKRILNIKLENTNQPNNLKYT